ncbi:MAG TPA: hypothetical protein VD866_04905 [Urbifossiella sp.]|nr:hypothetical protein [Urbifossiella sp.]
MAAVASLWPEINVDIVTPVSLLKAQAGMIGRLTKGILDAEVTSFSNQTTGEVIHRLDLLAPSVDDRRVRVLTATHGADFYPVVLEAECYRPSGFIVGNPRPFFPNIGEAIKEAMDVSEGKPGWRPVVGSYEELTTRLREVFASPQVRGAIDTLIALSNEKLAPTDPGAAAPAA